MEKPIVFAKDGVRVLWFEGVEMLTLIPENHPNPHGLVTNGKRIRTSKIVSTSKVDGTDIVETRNTRYVVRNWLIKETISAVEGFERDLFFL